MDLYGLVDFHRLPHRVADGADVGFADAGNTAASENKSRAKCIETCFFQSFDGYWPNISLFFFE